ncbi:MAG: family 10 glycosylhydrolase [Epulopiscium sp.]|nr:family 10 glycosylhydrolase [Candidatus Epulonipiscium sp.]
MYNIYRYLKNVLMLTLILSITCSSIPLTYGAESGNYINHAQTLKELGLFQGTEKGFELNRKSNRVEAGVMLVRLLGAEGIALEEADRNFHPFADVPQWASPHIAYLYQKGLTKGMSSTLYGSKNEITPTQYTTMLLRALGYRDDEGDFDYNTALEFAFEIGMLDYMELYTLKSMGNGGIIRDYMALLSYNCLFEEVKNQGKSLVVSLIEDNVISSSDVEKACRRDDSLGAFLVSEGYFKDYDIEKPISKDDETRAVWISYLDLQRVLPNKSKEEFRASIQSIFKNIADARLNTVIVQVRPFGDAFYPSNYFPWSYIITGTEGTSPGFDPLEIMLEEAHNKGLKFEAWINPYRIRAGSKKPLSEQNQALTWLMDGSNRVIELNSGIYYNPASKDVRELITKGVMEIVKNYDVDGIHFDDYFYPTTSLEFDKIDYQKYIEEGGVLSQGDWRRENVNQLIKNVYSSIKSYDSSIRFGISPQGIIDKNYNEQYIDVEKWLSSSGYIDYICPQIYFGYNHSTQPYAKLLEQWNSLIKNEAIDLYIGLAAYKLGNEDTWAGNGKTEWIGTTNMLQRMIADGRKHSHYGGFVLFRYDSLWNPPAYLKSQIDSEIHSIRY